jgi:predicted RNase H-related nuclease YkuK (DUF458 family)
MNYKDRFKRFDGEHIPDIIEYLREYLENDPTTTISVGCDSVQMRRRTIYALTIMMHNTDIRNGAHVVFFRESCPKIRENQERLYKEAQYVHDVATYLDVELSKFYKRTDLTPIERKRYKYHVSKCEGEYSHVPNHQEDDVIKNLPLLPADDVEWKLVDIHVDFNPFEGRSGKNKSYVAYKSFVPWLKGMGFRVWSKPNAFAATSGADLLLKNK